MISKYINRIKENKEFHPLIFPILGSIFVMHNLVWLKWYVIFLHCLFILMCIPKIFRYKPFIINILYYIFNLYIVYFEVIEMLDNRLK